MKKTSQRSLLFRQNVNRTEADRRRVCPRHGVRGIKTQLRPRRRAMDRAAIGNRHIIWQLTPCGKVAGDVSIQRRIAFQFIACALMRVVNCNRPFEAIANRRNWAREVGISAYKGKCVYFVFKRCVKNHLRSNVDIGAFFFKLYYGGHAIAFRARNTWFLVERHFYLVLGVETFDDFDTWQCGKSLNVEVLAKEFVRIWRIRFYGCGKILYGDDFYIVGNHAVREFLKIKPLIRRAFQHSVVKIEPIDIDIYFHRLENAKAGLSPGLAPPQQCLGGWLERIVPNIFLGHNGVRRRNRIMEAA